MLWFCKSGILLTAAWFLLLRSHNHIRKQSKESSNHLPIADSSISLSRRFPIGREEKLALLGPADLRGCRVLIKKKKIMDDGRIQDSKTSKEKA
jgi:hypothetical protein